LCIAQQDTDERNHQVSIMSSIYGDAEHVLIWLGSRPRLVRVSCNLVDVLNTRLYLPTTIVSLKTTNYYINNIVIYILIDIL
jgi:hypothetical protein